jgi:signal transduction histidine kinase
VPPPSGTLPVQFSDAAGQVVAGFVDERTADLREASDEIQRFAYIVSHDLRSPLVNIMGFTSELEQLRDDIFKRIATLARASPSPAPAGAAAVTRCNDGPPHRKAALSLLSYRP